MTREVNLGLEIYSPLPHWLWKSSADVSIVLILLPPPPECESTNWIGPHIPHPSHGHLYFCFTWNISAHPTLASICAPLRLEPFQTIPRSEQSTCTGVAADDGSTQRCSSRQRAFFSLQKGQNGFFNLQPQMQNVSLHPCAPASFLPHFHQEGQTDATQTRHIANFDLLRKERNVSFIRVLFTSAVFISHVDQEKKDSSSGKMEPVCLLRSN